MDSPRPVAAFLCLSEHYRATEERMTTAFRLCLQVLQKHLVAIVKKQPQDVELNRRSDLAGVFLDKRHAIFKG